MSNDGESAGDVAAEHAPGLILHAIGEWSGKAVLGLLGLILDVIQIPGDVSLKPVPTDPAPSGANPEFWVAICFKHHDSEVGNMLLSSGEWVSPACSGSASDAASAGQQHVQQWGEKYGCTDADQHQAGISKGEMQSIQ